MLAPSHSVNLNLPLMPVRTFQARTARLKVYRARLRDRCGPGREHDEHAVFLPSPSQKEDGSVK